MAKITRSHTRAKRKDRFGYSTCANKLSLKSNSTEERFGPEALSGCSFILH